MLLLVCPAVLALRFYHGGGRGHDDLFIAFAWRWGCCVGLRSRWTEPASGQARTRWSGWHGSWAVERIGLQPFRVLHVYGAFWGMDCGLSEIPLTIVLGPGARTAMVYGCGCSPFQVTVLGIRTKLISQWQVEDGDADQWIFVS